MEDDEFDKHMDKMGKNFSKVFGFIALLSVLGAISSLSIIITAIYLLIKNFG